jgi:thiol-disulfide isomerase/thioredoxin
MRKQLIFALLAFTLIFSACAPAAQPEVMEDKPTEAMTDEKPMEDKPMEAKPTDAMGAKPTDAMMDKPTATPEAMTDKTGMMAAPAWFGVALTNVRSGETFTVNDFKGKVVLVETLAMWCPNCKKQQMQVHALHELLGDNPDFVSIGLDIDANENGADLKTYTDSNGFDWIYAVAPAEVSRELGNLYGAEFLNPPSTPMFIIDRKGEVHPLPFGIKSAEDLLKAIEPFLKDGM